ncbi:MAG TPA: hypothetical protein VEQ37_12155, partial [Actinomycetota bacterium]|nr:hypothetical protein [Actinomycetota bacterium]
FLEWSAEARASLQQELRDLVARQVEDMGVATKKDLDGLTARLERLEAVLNTGAKSRSGAARAKATSRAKATTRSKTARSSPRRVGTGRGRASRGSG